MFINKQLLKVCAAASLFAVAGTADAVVVANLTSEAVNLGGDEFHDGPSIIAETGDLLETVGSIAAEGGSGDGVRNNTSTMFDGKINTSIANGAQTTANAGGYWGNGHFVEFDLDTSVNTLGYDISLIQVIQKGDSFRGGINVAISVRTVGGSYTSLINPADAGTANNVNMYSITNDSDPLVASGIDGIRFDFSNTATGSISGWTVYRELDVVGTATVPEPSSLALLGFGGLLIARRRCS